MSFGGYERYKDSGVEWLGAVPEHWSLLKIKHFSSFRGGGTPSRDRVEYWNGDIPWVSPKDMKMEIISGTEEYITEVGLENSSSSLVAAGRLLMVVRSGILKHTIPVAINEVSVALNQDMKALSFTDGSCLKEFFLRWVQGLNDLLLLVWAKQGATVESIEHAFLAETVISLPPIPEQQTIAAFLDRETTKIDELIAEQKRLIELLKEKRQAVISHAVTKGLNPAAPMKDSGVAWLGEVPEHWEVRRLKQACEVFSSNVDKKSFENEPPVLLCNYTDVYYNEQITALIDFMCATASSDEIRKFTLRAGDTIITKDSETADDIAIAAYVPRDLPGVICGYHLAMVRPRGTTSGAFVKRLFDSTYAKSCFAVAANGLTRVGLGQYALNNVDLPFPSFDEQQTIAAFLDRETAKIDNLTTEAQHAITLLQERRTALISAAVTGKIDVRGLTLTQPAQEVAA